MSLEQYAADAEIKVNDTQLRQVATLASAIRDQQHVVEDAEKALKAAKATLTQLEERDLPDLMDEIGIAEIVTSSGAKVTLKDTLYASVPAKNKRPAAEWLMAHGHGSLVSEDIVVSFGKGEGTRVQDTIKILEQAGVNAFSVTENVNTGSIKALIKELQAEGIDVPLDLFGAYWKRRAVIK